MLYIVLVSVLTCIIVAVFLQVKRRRDLISHVTKLQLSAKQLEIRLNQVIDEMEEDQDGSVQEAFPTAEFEEAKISSYLNCERSDEITKFHLILANRYLSRPALPFFKVPSFNRHTDIISHFQSSDDLARMWLDEEIQLNARA